MTRDKQNHGLWLGLGLATGLIAGFVFLKKRQHARTTSPLRCVEEPRTALVTGASSGIGAVYARYLARMGFDLVLVARREARLLALADELMQKYNVRAEVLVADLANVDDIATLEAHIAVMDELCFLVNNAGFGLPGTFADNDISGSDAMIHVHVNASVRLTRAALPVMLARGRGAIVNVASLAAFYPVSGSATYAATKAYLKVFTEALHQELIGTGVRVQALCPGFTRTEMQDVSGVGAEWVARLRVDVTGGRCGAVAGRPQPGPRRLRAGMGLSIAGRRLRIPASRHAICGGTLAWSTPPW